MRPNFGLRSCHVHMLFRFTRPRQNGSPDGSGWVHDHRSRSGMERVQILGSKVATYICCSVLQGRAKMAVPTATVGSVATIRVRAWNACKFWTQKLRRTYAVPFHKAAPKWLSRRQRLGPWPPFAFGHGTCPKFWTQKLRRTYAVPFYKANPKSCLRVRELGSEPASAVRSLGSEPASVIGY